MNCIVKILEQILHLSILVAYKSISNFVAIAIAIQFSYIQRFRAELHKQIEPESWPFQSKGNGSFSLGYLNGYLNGIPNRIRPILASKIIKQNLECSLMEEAPKLTFQRFSAVACFLHFFIIMSTPYEFLTAEL